MLSQNRRILPVVTVSERLYKLIVIVVDHVLSQKHTDWGETMLEWVSKEANTASMPVNRTLAN